MVKTEGGRSSPAGNAGSGRHPWEEEELSASVLLLVPWSGLWTSGGGVERVRVAWGRCKPRTGVEWSALRVRGWLAAWGDGAVPVRTAESAECGRAAPVRERKGRRGMGEADCSAEG